MKYFITLFLLALTACSAKFHGDSRLLGSWKSINSESSDIYFDSVHYFIMDVDKSKKTAYGLTYKVQGKTLTTYADNVIYSVSTIVKLTTDTIILRNEKTDSSYYYIRNK